MSPGHDDDQIVRKGIESIKYLGKTRANANRARIRETLGVGKGLPVVKDDYAKTDPLAQDGDFFGYMAGAEQKERWRRRDGFDDIGLALEFDKTGSIGNAWVRFKELLEFLLDVKRSPESVGRLSKGTLHPPLSVIVGDFAYPPERPPFFSSSWAEW